MYTAVTWWLLIQGIWWYVFRVLGGRMCSGIIIIIIIIIISSSSSSSSSRYKPDRFPMVSMEVFIHIILPAALSWCSQLT
jgi:hypothetical protein